jgi:hypothetical protein
MSTPSGKDRKQEKLRKCHLVVVVVASLPLLALFRFRFSWPTERENHDLYATAKKGTTEMFLRSPVIKSIILRNFLSRLNFI